MLSKIQKHTIDIYDLKSKKYQVEIVNARDLLTTSRFDLFAKLFYIRNIDNDKELALKVYTEHIKAFNPDFCEPGRDDKTSLNDFISAFDKLINHFKDKEFDSSISVIPVSEDYVILDGAHRLAALAYWNKKVEIVRFSEVKPKGVFDFRYFRHRGLSISISNIIANEIFHWKSNIHIACLWPKMGNTENKDKAITLINSFSNPFYIKSTITNLKSLTSLIIKTYNHQDWVGTAENGYAGAKDKALRCFSFNKNIDFVFFTANNLEEVTILKEKIRNLFKFEKDTIHITDTYNEAKQLATLILTPEGQNSWCSSQKLRLQEYIKEYCFYFKNVIWLNFKIKVASYIKKIKH